MVYMKLYKYTFIDTTSAYWWFASIAKRLDFSCFGSIFAVSFVVIPQPATYLYQSVYIDVAIWVFLMFFVDQLAAGLRSAQDARVKQILPARLGALFAGHEALFIEDLRWRSELQPQVKTIAATSGKHVHLGLGFIVSTQVKWDYLRGRFAKMHVIIFSPCCWPIFFEKP